MNSSSLRRLWEHTLSPFFTVIFFLLLPWVVLLLLRLYLLPISYSSMAWTIFSSLSVYWLILLFLLFFFLFLHSRRFLLKPFFHGFRLLQALASFLALLLGFLLGILHQLYYFLYNILFFANRHVYSSPTYTGVIFNRFPRLYSWLLRMSYSKSFNKKRRAVSNRRYYLLFVWFFFSFFFRSLFLFSALWLKAFLLWFYRSSNGTFAPFLSLLFSFLFSTLHRLYAYFFLPLKQALSLRLFRVYITLRRFLYYLSVNDFVVPFHALFEEKNRGAQEQRTTYDNYYLSWNYSEAAPLSLPTFRPGILHFFSKVFSLSPQVRLLVLPALAILWLSYLSSLLLRSLLLLLWLPLQFFFEALFAVLRNYASTRFYFFVFLKSGELLSRVFAPRWGGGSALILLWAALGFLKANLPQLFMFLPFILYNILWLSFQALASLPLFIFRFLRFSLASLLRRPVLVSLLVSLFFFGPHLLFSLSQCFEALLYGPFCFYTSSDFWPPGPARSNLLMRDLAQLFSLDVDVIWFRKYHHSELHWSHIIYHYVWSSRATYDPFKQWNVWQKYFEARRRREGLSPRRFNRHFFSLYGDAFGFLTRARTPRGPTAKLFLLYKLTILVPGQHPMWLLPEKAVGIFDAIWHYQQTCALLWCTTLMVEYPYLGMLYCSTRLIHFFFKTLALLRSYPILGVLVSFYSTYYGTLVSLLREAILFFWQAVPPLAPLFFQGLSLSASLMNLSLETFFYGQEILRSAIENRGQGQPLGQGWAYLSFLWLLWEQQRVAATKESLDISLVFACAEALSHYVANLSCFLRLPLEFYPLPSMHPLCFYLGILSFVERWADTCSIYWQIPKRLWGGYNLWKEPYLLGYELVKNNRFLKGKHLFRRGLLSSEASMYFDLGVLLNYLCLEETSRTTAYGAEIRPGFPRWKRALILLHERRLITFYRVLNKPKFYAPWARHLGYLPLPESALSVSAPLAPLLKDSRLLKWPLFGPIVYFVILSFLAFFSYSFRKLFFPKMVEGGSTGYWSDFLQDKDLRWAEKLVLPHFSFSFFKRSKEIPLAIEGLPWASLGLKDFDALRRASLAYADFRMIDVKKLLPQIWQTFSETLASSSSVRRRRYWWQRKSWFYALHPRRNINSSRSFREGLYRYHFYDLKLLPMYRRLHEFYFAQPKRFHELQALVPWFDDFNLFAALGSTWYFMEDEELRAEYIFHRRYVQQRFSFINATTSYFQWLDARLFDHGLGSFFIHKEGFLGHWKAQSASFLGTTTLFRTRLTPLLFSKFIHKREHFFTVLEDAKIYPWIIFWFILFPFFLFFQGTFFFYGWRTDWSPKKARFAGAEYWLLWTELLLHFDPLSQFYYYIWSYSSISEHVLRAGSIRTMDDPGRWMRASQHEELYVWPYIRHWRFSETSFLGKASFQPNYFAFSTLSEQRLANGAMALGLLFLLFFFLLRCGFPAGRFLLLRTGSGAKQGFRRATLVQQLHYQRMKLQLKKGLLWFWLKA